MTARRDALSRVLIGIPWLIAYVVVIFPVVLLIGILGGILDVLAGLTLGIELRTSSVLSRLWDWAGQNTRWVLTGDGTFDLTP